MAWVLSAVLLVALAAVAVLAVVMARRNAALSRELTAALELPSGPALADGGAGAATAVVGGASGGGGVGPARSTTPESGGVEPAGGTVGPGAGAVGPAGAGGTIDQPDGTVEPGGGTVEPAGGTVAPAGEAGTTEQPGEMAGPAAGTVAAPGAGVALASGAPEGAPAPVSPAQPPDARLGSLWALTVLEQQRQWQLSVAGTTPSPGSAPDGLVGVLTVEVERIREEVGTPGSLDVGMTPPATADDNALIFHATRQLLALLVPHTQAFDLVLHRLDDDAVLELTCSGWEGPDHVADGVGRLLEAVAPAGGDLELDTLPGDRLQATLRLPLH